MNTISKHSSFTRMILGACLVCFMMAGNVSALSLGDQLSQANLAWKLKKYDKCQAIFHRVVTNFGSRSGLLYGPKFGNVYYRKGLTELKLAAAAKRDNNLEAATKWFEEAAKSFEICYKKYPN